jgi:DNA-binding MarR family transcriptional regulator
MTLGELAERERVSPPMVTKIVAALEERGLVAKSTDPGDRRICRVELAPGGQEWLAEARARSNAWLADRLATLSAAERSQLAASVPLLERLITT